MAKAWSEVNWCSVNHLENNKQLFSFFLFFFEGGGYSQGEEVKRRKAKSYLKVTQANTDEDRTGQQNKVTKKERKPVNAKYT